MTTRIVRASSSVLVSSPSLSRRRQRQRQRRQDNDHRLHRLKPHRRSSFRSFASSSSKRRSDDDDDDANNFVAATPNANASTTTRKPVSEWSLVGLLEELQRQEQKAMKKVSQATTRLREAKEIVDRLLVEENTLEELEKCPDVDALERDLREKRARLESVRALREMTSSASSGGKKKTSITDEEKWKECVELAIELDISDSPPPRPPRGPKKVKNANNKNAVRPRRPYFAYASAPSMDTGNSSFKNNETPTEIRVGRTSEDNDIVSLDPTNDPNEWWMHAAGCPGSHVVVKSTAPSDSALLDAALLAAKFSKASQVGRVKVSVVRCRQVSKPKGAKAGLVRLSGDVRTMEVRVDENLDRLDALEKTKDVHF
jgi:hypothetical protein